MRELRPFIDADGDIHLHGLEGGLATFEFTDEAGVARNMVGANVTFNILGFSKALTAGDLPQHMVLTLVASELPNSIGKVIDYVILDRTGPVPHVIIDGKLVMSGWRI